MDFQGGMSEMSEVSEIKDSNDSEISQDQSFQKVVQGLFSLHQ